MKIGQNKKTINRSGCFFHAVAGIVLCVLLMTGANAGAEELKPRVAALKGPTGMAFAHMMTGEDVPWEFTLAGAPDEISGPMIAGKLDIAAVPTNLACVLFNKTGGNIRALSVITGGMLYVLERGDSVRTVADLEGKKLLSAGQGAAPEYVFSFILEENGVNAEVTYSSEQSEVVALAAAGKADIVVLPEPHVTTLLSKDPSFRVALSLTELFPEAARKAGYEDAGLYMSTVIVRADYAMAHPEEVERFMEELEASVAFALSDPDAAAKEISALGIIPAEEIARKALPSCALTFITGEEMKTRLTPMLRVLYEKNPAAVGGRVPEESFFYSLIPD